jgi:Ca2+-binding EF-hand superfamily protein
MSLFATSHTHTAASCAYEHQECVICFDPLHFKDVSFLADEDGNKICDHYFHTECITEYESDDDRCPLCRKEFFHSKPVPPLALDPKAWFDAIDTNKDGSLTHDELVQGLKSQVPMDWVLIESNVDEFWYRWDKDHNGLISFEEFADEETGVLAYLKEHYPKNPRPDPPSLIEDYELWFDYWDEDHNGVLDKAEMTRALIKTFRMYHFDKEHAEDIVENIWPTFDTDGSGVIEKDEFCSVDNLGDAINAQLTHELRKEGEN